MVNRKIENVKLSTEKNWRQKSKFHKETAHFTWKINKIKPLVGISI